MLAHLITSRFSVLILSMLGFFVGTYQAHAVPVPSSPQLAATSYILMDYETGRILAEENADSPMEPASLTKIMTVFIIAHELDQGNISLDDEVLVSKNAWAKNFPESSKMFIEVNKTVKVRDLMKGIIVSSGNDATVAMAEHIAGTESGFAELMNFHAKKLGMTNTTFANSNGLSHDSQRTTARDIAILTKALIERYPITYKLYSTKDFTYNGIKQYNRNRLLWDKSLNVDGVKTGYTENAGFCLVTSATRDGMRLISVVLNANSKKGREQESKKLLNFGFRFFETVEPFLPGKSLHEERVWMGEDEQIKLGILNPKAMTIYRGQRKQLKATFEINERIVAPVQKGQKVGTLFVEVEGEKIEEMPLVALHDVTEGGWFGRFTDWIAMKFD